MVANGVVVGLWSGLCIRVLCFVAERSGCLGWSFSWLELFARDARERRKLARRLVQFGFRSFATELMTGDKT